MSSTYSHRSLTAPSSIRSTWASSHRIVGQSLKKRLYFHPPEVPTASALVTLEELAYPVCIERAPALLDTQFFEYLKVTRWPARIWVEGGDMLAPELLDIIHI
jgi:hypothetical protein